MKPALADYCILVLSFICVLKSEKCFQKYEREKIFEENNPFRLDCPISHYQRTNFTLNWYMNGNDTPLITPPFSRVFQQNTSLWFIPTIAQDSGLYHCSYRNSTVCYKYSIQIAALNNSAGLCFNENYHFEQTLFPKGSSRIVCHQVNYFGQEVDYSSIQWYKECEPVQGERFALFRNQLIIKELKKDDEGKYVCKGTYTFRGKKYNFSNSILMNLLDSAWKRTEILYPLNNTIEADVGSNVFTECNVSSFRDSFIPISWKVNYTQVDSLFNGRIIEGNQTNIPKDGAEIFTVSLNITKVKTEDYDQQFTCHAGKVAAYIKIQRPTKNYAAFVILILLLIIPILICILFKIEIVLWYRKSCRPFFHKKVSDGKIYDAYVLYPKISNQADFVLKVLPEVLEKQCGYSLFIPGRDDLPGKGKCNQSDVAYLLFVLLIY
ncbi:PREDICTED: interleukin-1 receptor type 1-like [Thamnophis sirtalis]|uniref:Interleukin-1 receptor type 1-like n=1 Tax=Thamnophis sirtalis TaxID=35019 RepID=A0A6I9YE34_9SAUR|nr:PREDICTED: interleukin-1 receptor type 1-like [Thamnophis sirtalis]XP_013922438.1 PREDICTED: interleukin-1 receptor type 1-like [Thamnophis sirtalis]